jgi:hypothetical protein
MTHPIRPVSRLSLALLTATAALCIAPAPASAADLFVDAGLSIELSDNARFFLNLSNRHYAPPQPVAVDVLKRCTQPADDFPVVLFIAEAAHQSPAAVLDLRLRGRSWGEIMASFNVTPDLLFTGMDRDPGPPYGRAWGYWRKHRASKSPWRLDDPDIVGLAKLQTVSAYYRVSPYRVSAEVQRGITVEAYAVAHGQPPVALPAKGPHGSKTKGKGHDNPHRGQHPGQQAPYGLPGGPHHQRR